MFKKLFLIILCGLLLMSCKKTIQIKGRIIESESGKAITNARIILWNSTVIQSDNSGDFDVILKRYDLPDKLSVRVLKPGYTTFDKTFDRLIRSVKLPGGSAGSTQVTDDYRIQSKATFTAQKDSITIQLHRIRNSKKYTQP